LLDLSISLVNWNTKGILRSCLKSICKSTHRISYEILVVDNGSSDESPEMVEKEFPQVKLIRNRENLGFAKANNQAIKLSSGRYILLLNSDTIVLDGALDKMVEFMNTHPDAGAAGCKLLDSEGNLQKSINKFPSLFCQCWGKSLLPAIFPKIKLGYVIDEYHFYSRIQEVDWITGAFLVVSKLAIERVGLLDEIFFIYAEDTDLCWRIRKEGWKIYFYPGAKVVHFGGVSIKKRENKSIGRRLITTSACQYSRKYYGPVGSILVCLTIAFSSGCRLIVWSIDFLFFSKRRDEIWRKIEDNWVVFKTGFELLLGNKKSCLSPPGGPSLALLNGKRERIKR